MPDPRERPAARSIATSTARPRVAVAGPEDLLTEEVRRLQSLAQGEAMRVRTPEESKNTIPELVHLINSGAIDATELGSVLDAILRNDRLLPALAALASMDRLAHEVRKWLRQQALKDFREAVTGADRTDGELPALLRGQSWMFGGTLAHVAGLDEIPGLDDAVIPLRRFDEALHIVLVGRARVGDLVARDVTGYRVSGTVAEACDRARYVVRELTRRNADAGEGLYADGERPHVTVVVGHPRWVAGEPDPTVIHRELRLYNTFLAGINVITYAELLKTAERMLDIDNPYGDVPGEPEDFGRDLGSVAGRRGAG